MKKSSSFVLSALMLFSDHAGTAKAFCPSSNSQYIQQMSSITTTTKLGLVPGQGKQLEAAVNAAQLSSEQSKQQEQQPAAGTDASEAADASEPSSSSSHWRALSASRSFVTRLFHLPSNAIKHPHPVAEGLKDPSSSTTSSSSSSSPATFPTFFVPGAQQKQEQKQSSFSIPSGITNKNQQHESILYPIVGFTFCKTKNDGCIALPTTSHASCRITTNAQRQEEVFGWYSPACKLDLYSEDVCHKPIDSETSSDNVDSTTELHM
mmetsp:Transcript_20652/g.49002  ORF Transcript_20652/g.49002 Transcript_20652/m.49002 type:complete len:264 (+) Transcript_20652:336-1127(+)|eukprot:CAMPEP_0113483636 /NCGR_PEP_ID=MMETSP0014_2-20120614/23536_1 /TAXON_ID=2857 /ORGANISM="Nitzschia sp." /LENGTH=263 /DNA_ID=CAMNT_0000377189 /DNA_START=195 /DNA_END=986 /DNA_ORIENTATION=- /assembly_acc=CAM_ASM_000159